MKVFLGGTCNESRWREDLIPLLEKNNIKYFNPVVDDWTDMSRLRENLEKDICDIHLYVITPLMTGVFSIAEAVQSSYYKTKKTIFIVLERDNDQTFTVAQNMSLCATMNLIKDNDGYIGHSLKDVLRYAK